MKKRMMIWLCLTLLFFSQASCIEAEDAASKSSPDLAKQAQAAYLMEYSSGKVIYAKHEEEKLYPASMTKMMGLLLIFEALHEDKLSLKDEVVTSAYAAQMGGSQVYLEENERMSVEDLLKSICIASANDAMVAMAEKVGGTYEHFIEMMNDKAKELGMAHTVFTNASGLHDPDHYSCAKDMALLGRALIKEGGEELLRITSTYDAYIREDSDNAFWLVNTNKLLKQYPGVDGLKSGYTSQAGSCITVTAKKQGLRLIAVVMKEPDSKTRNQEISAMLDYGFSQYEQGLLYPEGEVMEQLQLEDGKPSKAELVTKEDLIYVYEKGKKPTVKKKEILLDKKRAPYEKGEEVGRIRITMSDGYMVEGTLCIRQKVEALSFFDLFLRGFCDTLA